MPRTMSITLLPERCEGCYACHIACVRAHPAVDAAHGRAYCGMKVITFDDGSAVLAADVCSHCGKCIEVCRFAEAFSRDAATGAVLLDPAPCFACGECFKVCTVLFPDAAGVPVKCDGCRERVLAGGVPACVEICDRGALVYEVKED